MHLKKFQEDTIEKLRKAFLNLWQSDKRGLPLVLKAPTGSGKTIMTAEFLRQLVNDPQFQEKKAYVWITFSEELYSQSKKKLFSYYDGASEINLLDLNDLSKKRMKENNIFFINWQKVKASNKDGRKLRKETEYSIGDKGIFDEFIINTQKDGIELVLIIDEAHTQVGTSLADEIVDLINPKIIFKITATPKSEDVSEAIEYDSLVNVKQDDVIREGLIKEKILTQTKEDIEAIKETEIDQDKFLIELAYNKREELKKYYEELDLDINPLVLIQLPNDDKKEDEALSKSKLEFIISYLIERGVKKQQVAIWLSEKKENLELIEKNNSPKNFLIFKQAAATGWDCPRAGVLVMFREIKNPSFHIQTVGRILRMPLGFHFDIPELNRGYLYTNYNRNDVLKDFEKVLGNNKPFVYQSKLKDNITPITLDSIYLGRTDYNDLSPTFENTLFETLNNYFGINTNSLINQTENFNKLLSKGINVNADKITNSMIADVEILHFDHFLDDLKNNGVDINASISLGDLERLYDLTIYNFITSQEIEARKYAPARSWKAFRNSINSWFLDYITNERPIFKAIIINDFQKEDSVLRNICSKALENYKPIRLAEVKEKEKRSEDKISLSIPRNEIFYTSDYNLFSDFEINKSALFPFYLKPNYSGRVNEVGFIKYLEENNKIDWWYKNGDSGREFFAIKYFDTFKQNDSLFYPDWIVKLNDGRILIVDTKDGNTAISQDTKDKAEELQKWIKSQKGFSIVGGIVLNVGGEWKVNNKEVYNIDKDYKDFISLSDVI
ncbi:MAG: DEAD/DEAH box helicase family protein [Candidatus Gracilibacteria bacterium]|nr:DEAD/DEAH box helicase family protein [Candidatus Gracilibacteria bacterium]